MFLPAMKRSSSPDPLEFYSSCLRSHGARRLFRVNHEIHETALPEFHAKQAVEQRGVLGKPSFMLAEELFHKKRIEKATSPYS